MWGLMRWGDRARRSYCGTIAAASISAPLPSLGLENDDRDLPAGPLLVPLVLRPNDGHQTPQPGPLLADGSARLRHELLCADLQVHLGVVAQVEIPHRVLVAAAFGPDHDGAIAVPSIDQRGAAQL